MLRQPSSKLSWLLVWALALLSDFPGNDPHLISFSKHIAVCRKRMVIMWREVRRKETPFTRAVGWVEDVSLSPQLRVLPRTSFEWRNCMYLSVGASPSCRRLGQTRMKQSSFEHAETQNNTVRQNKLGTGEDVIDHECNLIIPILPSLSEK